MNAFRTTSFFFLLLAAASLSVTAQSNPPFCINMTINGDPATQMAFAWFTNPTIEPGTVQLVAKPDATAADFASPLLQFSATATQVKGLNYSTEGNALPGVTPNQKVDYTSHKALATDLEPSTTYSYRVGNGSEWSPIGSFTTAAAGAGEAYSFLYIADTQAETVEQFEVSHRTVRRAVEMFPDASFMLCTGDIVDSAGAENSEWEYQQWLDRMQDVWLRTPLVITMGNHDGSRNHNFYYHFNNSDDYDSTAAVATAMGGTVFSFVRGEVLYLVISFEDYKKEGYLESLAEWMRQQVAEHSDAKWRVACYHRAMFTGGGHQCDQDSRAYRAKMLPVFDELGINVGLQGHDHIYEVIGPVDNLTRTLIRDEISDIDTDGAGGTSDNMTGRAGGTFNVDRGTLYFLNGSAGKKKYWPYSEQHMIDTYAQHGVANYWDLFSGKYGQNGLPAFSYVEVRPESLVISTYSVADDGSTSLFDSFKVVKSTSSSELNQLGSEEATFVHRDDFVTFTGADASGIAIYTLEGRKLRESPTIRISTAGLSAGIYIVTCGAHSTKIAVGA